MIPIFSYSDKYLNIERAFFKNKNCLCYDQRWEKYAFLQYEYATYLSKYALIFGKLKYALICQKLTKKSIFIPSLVMTINRRQECFLNIYVDVGRSTKSKRLLYIGLSRVRNWQGLFLAPFSFGRFQIIGN